MIDTIVRIDNMISLYSYEEYKNLVFSLYDSGKVTGNIQNKDKLEATKINIARMNRWDKTFEVNVALKQKLNNITTPMMWYVISEGWCGDCAQLLPLISKIAESTSSIELKILTRDENPNIMNAYLTNGGAAVPKLIARNKATNADLFTWGPRPSKIKDMVLDYKNKFTLNNKEEFHKNLHLWYARDKGNALQEDFLNLLT